MSMVRLEGLKDLLILKDLREKIGNGVKITATLKDGSPGYELTLKRATGDNKIIYEGRLRYPLIVQGEIVYPSTNVYGCLCFFSDGEQGISLKKSGGGFIAKEIYQKIDQFLDRVLSRHLLAKLLDVKLEYKGRKDYKGIPVKTYAVINPGLWGKQSCSQFKWRNEAILNIIELKQQPVEGKRGPYRVCGNCNHRDDCSLCVKIKANRKREPKVPVEVEVS